MQHLVQYIAFTTDATVVVVVAAAAADAPSLFIHDTRCGRHSVSPATAK